MLNIPHKEAEVVQSLVRSSLASIDMMTCPIIQHEDNEENKTEVITQLLTTIPDSLIKFNHEQEMPVSKEFLGVTMFADISGFTALTEKYSAMETEQAGRGTDKLCATLNTYIGMIVDEIVIRNGDVLKFAGDAILALWKFSNIGHNAKTNLNKVIKCCFDIQEKCDNFMTEVGIVLRVKLAVAVGSMCLTIVGLPKAKQFDLSGSAIVDVGVTEKEAVPGSIILSQLAWTNCDQNLFSVEPIKDGRFYRVFGQGQIFNKNKDTNKDGIASNLEQHERLITSDIDYAIDKILDYRQDMPKALQPDIDDEKISTGFFLSQKLQLLPDNNKTKKKKKFDRLTMTYDLNDDEIKQLRAYVPEQILYKLDHGQNLEWLSEMRQVSVLFINMQLPDFADEASLSLQKSFEVIYEACVEFSGTLNKVFSFDKGCTFIVIFGLPGQKQNDDAIRALKCAHSIFTSLHALQEISNESIGVTTGLAFCGVVGHKDRHEYTVIGSKVNMAARLMMFYPQKLTCDNDTYEAARMRLREEDFITMPYVELKGLKDPGAVREYDPHSNNDDEEDDFDYPILGRKYEINNFNYYLDQYQEKRRKKVIVIGGDQGIGKTRLLEEFMDGAAKKLYRIIHLPLGSLEECQHIGSNMLKLLLGTNDEERHANILPLMQEDQEIKENVGLISDLLGDFYADTTHDNTPETNPVGERRRNIMIKIIRIFLDKQEQKHFFAIDNAMHLGVNSWQFLDHLLKKSNIIISFAIRSWDSNDLCPEARRVLQNDSEKLLLEGLNKDIMVDFVCQLLHVNMIPKKLCSIIETKGQGIPSWCEQLIENMLYSNIIEVRSYFEIFVDTPVEPDLSDNDYNDNDLSLSSSQFILKTVDHQLKKSTSNNKYYVQSELYKQYKKEEYIEASVGAISEEITKVCVISPNADVNAMLVPDSVEDMVLARMDRLSPTEQTVIKCAAVLGLNFSRDLLKAIIPKNCANMIDTTLQNLSKMQFFECASLVKHSPSAFDLNQQSNNSGGAGKTHHHHAINQNVQILCGCHAIDGYQVINLLQSNAFSDGKKKSCLYFHFCNDFVQETAFALWLEDQRRALFEKAALYLETNSEKCRSCGGNGFVPGTTFTKTTNIEKPTGGGTGGGKKYSIFSRPRIPSVARPDKNLRLQDLKKAIPNYPKDDRTLKSGDVVGMALVQLSNLYNLSDAEETSTKRNSYLRKKNVRLLDKARVTLETSLINFCNSTSNVRNRSSMIARDRTTTKNRDLSQCQCIQLQAFTTPKLVHYWKSAGSKIKAFQYSIEVASIALDTNDSLKAIDTLTIVDEIIKSEEEDILSNFIVSDEERAKIESLRGQALFQMDCYEDAVRHFTLALEHLKCPPPVSRLGFHLRLWKASMVQSLHQKMPGVFIDAERDFSSNMIHQTNILSNLAKAHRARKEFDKAYLANLEQLNAAEEGAMDCWREVMIAYADMIGCLHLYGKEGMGAVLEKAALDAAEKSSVHVDDLLAVGNLHFSLLVYYSFSGNLSKAFDAGSAVYNIGSTLNDVKLLVTCIPPFVQVSILKMRFHSCDSMITELGQLTKICDSRNEKWIYNCCCIDMLLHTGEYADMMNNIASKLLKNNIGGSTSFAMNYANNGLALWYARQNKWANAMTYYIDAEHQVQHHSVDTLFYCNAVAISTEFLLHQFRHDLSSEHTQLQVKNALKIFQKETSGKGFLEARLFHFQAYFAYLKKKYHRARLLLEECMIESKNNDLTFDYEWAQASKNTWFAVKDVDVENQTSFGTTISYVLPAV